MPGILPMKVIKVGSTAQTRIAQACDRCRSKKIRCDGNRPCCTQCANVGFECKTSDKLSRRAFPRGYTESLEERIRALEAEVRELKDLVDEKDEKLEMLSKMHSHRRSTTSPSSVSSSFNNRNESISSIDEVFRVQASPLLLEAENTDLYSMGASSGRCFLDAFERKLQESGKPSPVNMAIFLNSCDTPQEESFNGPPLLTAPPRMFTDRCVNIFLQEWAPLFPILHKPSFLSLYEDYVTYPERTIEDKNLAQLHLVFGIAALSSEMSDKSQIAQCERQWKLSLDAILMENTLITLQCLTLALLYCVIKGDYNSLQHYKGVAMGLSHRLGLHQNQKRFSFGALTMQTRKKVFWSLYTVDCFTAATLGLPKLLMEEDVHAEYPSDTDDEYVTEKGFQPAVPGEYTRLSSALALFRVARILSKVLEHNYPAASAHNLSQRSLDSLESELEEWSASLPQHLKLTFLQDKPSTNVTGSRSALLSLSFYYIRTLIRRPAAASITGHIASPSIISVADSSKHIIQIVQLLDERNMTFSFCLNKNELLTFCGLSLLYQGLDLRQEGKLILDNQRLIVVVVDYLNKTQARGASDFTKLAAALFGLEKKGLDLVTARPTTAPVNIRPALPHSQGPSSPPQLYMQDRVFMSEANLIPQQEKLRRMTFPSTSMQRVLKPTPRERRSFDLAASNSPLLKQEYISPPRSNPRFVKQHSGAVKPPNLDYLSLNPTPEHSQPQSPILSRNPTSNNPPSRSITTSRQVLPPATAFKPSISPSSDWDHLFSSLDTSTSSFYDSVFSVQPLSLSLTNSMPSSNYDEWSPESWDMDAMSPYELSLEQDPTNNLSEHSSNSSDDALGRSKTGIGKGQCGSPNVDRAALDGLRGSLS